MEERIQSYSSFERFGAFLMIVLLVGSIVVPIGLSQNQQMLEAKQGVLDLRNWDFAAEPSLPLDGEWRFYPEKFVDADSDGRPHSYIQVPGAWNQQKIDGKPFPIQTYGSYRLTILLPVAEGDFGIKTRNIRSANRLYVNGKLEGSAGVAGPTRESTTEKNNPYAAYFELDGSTLELVMHVSSFEGFSSGISHSLTFGTEAAIQSLNNYFLGMDFLFSFGFMLSGLYFLSIYAQRRQFREQLFFSLFSFSVSLYFLTTSERLLWDLFPSITMLLHLYLQISSSLLVAMFLSLYVYSSFPHLYPHKLIRFIVTTNLGIIGLLPIIPTEWYIYTTTMLMGMMIANLMIDLYILGKAIRNKEPQVMYIVLAFLSIFILFPMAIINIMWTLDLYYFLPASLPVLAISQALYMAKKYTAAFETVKRLSEQLQTLDKVKDEFLAKTSHELKTPLNGIINISQSLLDGAHGSLNESHRDDVRLMRDIGRRLSSLVHDILDYSKAKNRDIVLYRKAVDLHAPVSVIIDTFSFSKHKPELRILHQIEPGTFILDADDNRLSQILFNLVDNAIKFTEKGSVVVSAERIGDQVAISVRDTGRGIPATDFERIFDSFEQLESTLTRTTGGVGLGLAISKQLVELHGGSISIQSEVGKGTVMTFMMPVASEKTVVFEAPPSTLPDVSIELDTVTNMRDQIEETSQSPHHVHRILVVDDEYSNVRAIQNTLQLEGYELRIAMDGNEAIRLVRAHGPFDLVILDVMMPGLSGYDVAKAIREQHSTLELPILFLTARTQTTDLAQAFAVGANDFVEKPYDTVELKSRVATLVQLKHLTESLLAAELRLLQAQIRPHFVYNVLSTVISLCYSDAKLAAKVLLDFSQFMRKNMYYLGSSELISIEEELDTVRRYLSIENVRFGERLQVSFELDEEALSAQIPPLSIQPLVENAVKHGISAKEEGGRIVLRVTLDKAKQHVEVEVTDDGVGVQREVGSDLGDDGVEEGNGLALYNVQRRLLATTGSRLQIESKQGAGTTVSFHVPLR